MKSQRFFLSLALIVCVTGLAATGCETIKQKIGRGSKDIVATAMSKGDFKTFCEALQKAGLEETLRGPGPFTVLMPTDEAFQMLPAGKVDELMEPGMKDTLVGILKHHIIQGKYSEKDLKKTTSLRALDNKMLVFALKDNNVMVGEARITTKDIKCKNGVIHVIDVVMMP